MLLLTEETRRATESPGRTQIEPYIAALCVAAIAWHLVSRFAFHVSDRVSNPPLLIAIAIGAPLCCSRLAAR